MLQLNKQDQVIIEQGVEARFWELVQAYVEERKEQLKLSILSWLDEERSKSKRNDRDLVLAELLLLDELLQIPSNLKTRISNQTDSFQEE